MHKSRLAGLIIDCKEADLPQAAEFWAKALGMHAKEPRGNLYVALETKDQTLHIEVQRVTHESRVHLDIETDHIEAEVERLQQLGARKIEFFKNGTYSWWVMEAPTGHRFCVVQALSSHPMMNEWDS